MWLTTTRTKEYSLRMSQLATWALTVITALTAHTQTERLRSETEVEMQTRYASIGTDLEDVLLKSKPLFGDDENRHKTAALMLAIASFESGFVKSVDVGSRRGDNGESYCIMQVRLGKQNVYFGPEEMRAWKGADLSSDRKKCFAAGLEALRLSVSRCGTGPNGRALNIYASGSCETPSAEAKHRWVFSQQIARRFPL